MDLHKVCTILVLGLFPVRICVDIEAKTGGAAIFYLPPFSQCGSYRLVNPNKHTVMTVFNETHIQIHSGIYGTRVHHEKLANGTIRISLQLLMESDRGTYVVVPDDGVRCQQKYFYALVLTDGAAYWLDWNPWQPCSLTCGLNGVRERTRHCTKSYQCQGQSVETERARCDQTVSCGRDFHHWRGWTSWSECSLSCGEGTRIRRRDCSGTDCVGNSVEESMCNEGECHSAAWAAWTAWTVCSEKCGDGRKNRSRRCLTGQRDSMGGCGEGANRESISCRIAPCFQIDRTPSPPRYSWTSWSLWSQCKGICGTGTRARSRTCLSSENRTVSSSFCGNGDEDLSDCYLHACDQGQGIGPHARISTQAIARQSSSLASGIGQDSLKSTPNGARPPAAKDIGITVPLSAIVGTVAGFLILLLLIVVIVLVTRLRRKSRKQRRNMTSGQVPKPGTHLENNRRASTKSKKTVSICDESSSHCYAEVDEDILQKRNKSKSIVTLDNPYSDLPPRSASPFYKNPDSNSAVYYKSSVNEGSVFVFGNQTDVPTEPLTSQRTDVKKSSRCGNRPLDDLVDGGYLTCTPDSSQDELDRKPKRYVKKKN